MAAKTKAPAAPPMHDELGELKMIPLESLIPAEDNVRDRAQLDPTSPEILAMAISMKEVGVLEPLLVEPHPFEDGSYRIKAGGRRLVAAGVAGLPGAPCIVAAVEESVRQTIFVVENVHREGLSPIEQARGFKQMADAGISQRDIGQKCGVSQGHVSKMMGLLRLPETAQEWVGNGKLTQEAALTIASLPAPAQKELVAEGVPAEWEIKAARLRFEIKRKIDEETKKAEAEGRNVIVVDHFDAWYQEDPLPAEGGEEGEKTAVLVNSAYGTLAHVDAGEHLGEPCSVVLIDSRRGEVRQGCTNPNAHPRPEGEDDEDDGSGDRPSIQQERNDRRAVADAVEDALMPSIRRAVEAADNATGVALVELLAFAVPIFVRCDECYVTAAATMDFLQVPNWDRAQELDELATLAESSPVTAMVAFALLDTLATLQQVVGFVKDGTPVDAIEEEMPDHVRDARALINHLRTACPDDGIGTLEDIVSDFGEVERGDQVDADAEDQEEPDPTDAEAADGDGTDELPEITIVDGGKSGAPKFFRDCSACGRLTGFNTNRDDAVDRGYKHLVDDHGAEPLEAA